MPKVKCTKCGALISVSCHDFKTKKVPKVCNNCLRPKRGSEQKITRKKENEEKTFKSDGAEVTKGRFGNHLPKLP